MKISVWRAPEGGDAPAFRPMKTVAASLAMAALFMGQGSDRARADETEDSVENIEYHNTDAQEACAAFRISEDTIIAHFRAARPATPRDYTDDWYSPCMAIGVLRTADGARDFNLRSSGIALLRGDGEEAYVFAEPVWFDPFGGGYRNRD